MASSEFEQRLARINSQEMAAPGQLQRDRRALSGKLNRKLSWELIGVPGSALVGLVMGYVAMYLAYTYATNGAENLPGSYFWTMLADSLTFSMGMVVGPALAIPVCILLGFRSIFHILIAMVCSKVSGFTAEAIADHCLNTFHISPPAWVSHALQQGSGW